MLTFKEFLKESSEKMKTWYVFQDYTGNFCTAIRLSKDPDKDRYLYAGEVSGKVRCRWTGYTVDATSKEEAIRKYDEGDY